MQLFRRYACRVAMCKIPCPYKIYYIIIMLCKPPGYTVHRESEYSAVCSANIRPDPVDDSAASAVKSIGTVKTRRRKRSMRLRVVRYVVSHPYNTTCTINKYHFLVSYTAGSTGNLYTNIFFLTLFLCVCSETFRFGRTQSAQLQIGQY